MKTLLLIIFLLLPLTSWAQLERKRVQEVFPVELTFMAPRTINVHTTEPLSKGELHYSIMHTFGEINNGWRNMYGLDNGANTRFTVEYGFTSSFSAWIGRSSLDKVFEAGSRYHMLRQMNDNSTPVSVSGLVAVGITSADFSFAGTPNWDMYDRTNMFAALQISRKFTPRFSMQLSPMFARFNRTGFELNLPQSSVHYYGLAFSGRYKLGSRVAFTRQFLFRFDENFKDLPFNVALGLDIETGGHVFQLFMSTGSGLSDAYVLAGQNGPLFDGFRLGFNINRLFMVGN